MGLALSSVQRRPLGGKVTGRDALQTDRHIVDTDSPRCALHGEVNSTQRRRSTNGLPVGCSKSLRLPWTSAPATVS